MDDISHVEWIIIYLRILKTIGKLGDNSQLLRIINLRWATQNHNSDVFNKLSIAVLLTYLIAICRERRISFAAARDIRLSSVATDSLLCDNKKISRY